MNPNKELQHLYNSLTPGQKNILKSKLSDSPKLQELVLLLESGKYSTTSAVSTIYKDDADLEFNVLKNRFFKLKAKLISLLEDLETTSDKETLPEEELELQELETKLYDLENQEKTLLRLEQLKKKCWERNIFELPPRIIMNVMQLRANMRLPHVEENAIEFEKASHLLYTLNGCYKLFLSIRNNKKSTQTELRLEQLRQIHQKNKEYHRFSLIYNETCLRFKIEKQRGLLQRQYQTHFQNFTKTFNTNPKTPIYQYFYQHEKYSVVNLLYWSMVYHFNKGEMLESVNNAIRISELLHKNVYLSKHFFSKLVLDWPIYVLLNNDKYQESIKFLNLYRTAYSNQKSILFDYTVLLTESLIYTHSFPKINHSNPNELFHKLNELYSKIAKLNEDEKNYCLLMQLRWAFILNKKEKLAELLKKEKFVTYLTKSSNFSAIVKLYEALNNKEELANYITYSNKLINQELDKGNLVSDLVWSKKIATHHHKLL
ncbi:MAG: hypothetical protein J0M08_03480 [Bacteroidetes bacterium]|nr:hypothetical protein [Bacteroidota bacterium]